MSSRVSRRGSSRMSISKSRSRKRKSTGPSRSRSRKHRRMGSEKPSAYTGDLSAVVKRVGSRGAKHLRASNKLLNQMQLPRKAEWRDYTKLQASSQQSYTVCSILEPNVVGDMFYYVGDNDTSTRPYYIDPTIDAPSNTTIQNQPYNKQTILERSVLHLSSWFSRKITNGSNVDMEIDVYFFKPRHDVWKTQASNQVTPVAVPHANPVEQTALNTISDYIYVTTDDTLPPEDSTRNMPRSLFPTMVQADASLFDVNRFTSEFQITSFKKYVLAGGESKEFLLKDTKQRVFKTRYFNQFRQNGCLSHKNLSQHMCIVYRFAPMFLVSTGALTLSETANLQVEDHFGWEIKPILDGMKLHILTDDREHGATSSLVDIDPNDNRTGSEIMHVL